MSLTSKLREVTISADVNGAYDSKTFYHQEQTKNDPNAGHCTRQYHLLCSVKTQDRPLITAEVLS